MIPNIPTVKDAKFMKLTVMFDQMKSTCSMSSSFDTKGDHSRMVFKLLDHSSSELYIIGSAQWSEMSKSIYKKMKMEIRCASG